jgi:hypothetical protein
VGVGDSILVRQLSERLLVSRVLVRELYIENGNAPARTVAEKLKLKYITMLIVATLLVLIAPQNSA